MDIVDHRVPLGCTRPLHIHRDQDEVFYLLEGRLTVRCGAQEWQAGPRSLVFLPRGVPHGFTATPDGPARTLLINAPAGFADVITERGIVPDQLVIPARTCHCPLRSGSPPSPRPMASTKREPGHPARGASERSHGEAAGPQAVGRRSVS